MKQIEITDQAYETLTAYHGDVAAFVEKLAEQSDEVAAVQEGLDAYNSGDHRSLEDVSRDLRERFGMKPRGA